MTKTIVYAVSAAVVPAILALLPKPVHEMYVAYGYVGFEAFSATMIAILGGLWAFVMVFIMRHVR